MSTNETELESMKVCLIIKKKEDLSLILRHLIIFYTPTIELYTYFLPCSIKSEKKLFKCYQTFYLTIFNDSEISKRNK